MENPDATTATMTTDSSAAQPDDAASNTQTTESAAAPGVRRSARASKTPDRLTVSETKPKSAEKKSPKKSPEGKSPKKSPEKKASPAKKPKVAAAAAAGEEDQTEEAAASAASTAVAPIQEEEASKEEKDAAAQPTLQLEGRCACKSLTWKAVGKPGATFYCHCSLCRRSSGGPFVGLVSLILYCIFLTIETVSFQRRSVQGRKCYVLWRIHVCFVYCFWALFTDPRFFLNKVKGFQMDPKCPDGFAKTAGHTFAKTRDPRLVCWPCLWVCVMPDSMSAIVPRSTFFGYFLY